MSCLPTEVALSQEFFQGMRDVDRENEVHRILGAFKLNPFEQLGLRFDATVDDVKKAYRKSSLMVHPDKCKHPKAQDAFETLGQAQQQLNNDEKMKELIYVLTLARGESSSSTQPLQAMAYLLATAYFVYYTSCLLAAVSKPTFTILSLTLHAALFLPPVSHVCASVLRALPTAISFCGRRSSPCRVEEED